MPKHYRPLDDDPGPRPASASFDRALPGSTALAALTARWSDIVGASLAARARPLKVAGGTLVIAVDDPAWASQLKWFEADLIARCAEALGEGVVTATRTVVRPAPSS